MGDAEAVIARYGNDLELWRDGDLRGLARLRLWRYEAAGVKHPDVARGAPVNRDLAGLGLGAADVQVLGGRGGDVLGGVPLCRRTFVGLVWSRFDNQYYWNLQW